MASMTRTNADNAAQADQLMKEAQRVVTRANAAMDELSWAMERITAKTAKIVCQDHRRLPSRSIRWP